MDVVIPVRPGNRNDELRYALRSIHTHLPVGRVWIVGFRPTWLTGVEHIATDQDDHKHVNTLHNWRTVAEHPDIPPEFVLWNDDIFVMQPATEVPVMHRGPLDAYIARRRRTTGGVGTYTARAVETREALVRLGRSPEELLTYELHVPMPMVKATLAAALKELGSICRKGLYCYSKRTWYGNYARAGGVLAEDCKISDDNQWHQRGGRQAVETWPWLSTADGSFKYGQVGRLVRRRFPDPSPYELMTMGART